MAPGTGVDCTQVKVLSAVFSLAPDLIIIKSDEMLQRT